MYRAFDDPKMDVIARSKAPRMPSEEPLKKLPNAFQQIHNIDVSEAFRASAQSNGSK